MAKTQQTPMAIPGGRYGSFEGKEQSEGEQEFRKIITILGYRITIVKG
jgi:hypothetical protein